MRCDLCGKNTRCSCKGWGCPSCNSSNIQIQFMNDLIKFGLGKDVVRERMKEIHNYVGKIDTFTAYEFFSWAIDKETFDKAIEEFKPSNKKKASPKKSEVEWFKPTPNPDNHHKFPSSGARGRCIYCNGIKKYCEKEECPMWIKNQEEK